MTERELLAQWEAGDSDAGLVLADWLEEQGDERSGGVRWLADNRCAPRQGGGRWWWFYTKGSEPLGPCGPYLGADVWAATFPLGRQGGLPGFPTAIYAAASAWAATQEVTT